LYFAESFVVVVLVLVAVVVAVAAGVAVVAAAVVVVVVVVVVAATAADVVGFGIAAGVEETLPIFVDDVHRYSTHLQPVKVMHSLQKRHQPVAHRHPTVPEATQFPADL
jgi:membrane protein DedA with SNARE-associated domain